MCTSVSEVVREALRLLQERDVLQAMKLEALRQGVNQGLASLNNGAGKALDVNAIKAKGRKKKPVMSAECAASPFG